MVVYFDRMLLACWAIVIVSVLTLLFVFLKGYFACSWDICFKPSSTGLNHAAVPYSDCVDLWHRCDELVNMQRSLHEKLAVLQSKRDSRHPQDEAILDQVCIIDIELNGEDTKDARWK